LLTTPSNFEPELVAVLEQHYTVGATERQAAKLIIAAALEASALGADFPR
jgi:hypothetical protein